MLRKRAIAASCCQKCVGHFFTSDNCCLVCFPQYWNLAKPSRCVSVGCNGGQTRGYKGGGQDGFVRVGVESNYVNKGGGLHPGLREHLACFVGQEW